MDQFGGLLLDGFDDARVAVTGGNDGNARGKIQKLVAVHVFHDRAAPGFGHQRIPARVRRRNELRVFRDDCLRVGTRERRYQDRQLGVSRNIGKGLGHGKSSNECARACNPGRRGTRVSLLHDWEHTPTAGDGPATNLRRFVPCVEEKERGDVVLICSRCSKAR